MIRAESRPDRIVDFIYKFFRVMEMSLRIRLIAVPTNVKTIVMNKNKTIKKNLQVVMCNGIEGRDEKMIAACGT